MEIVHGLLSCLWFQLPSSGLGCSSLNKRCPPHLILPEPFHIIKDIVRKFRWGTAIWVGAWQFILEGRYWGMEFEDRPAIKLKIESDCRSRTGTADIENLEREVWALHRRQKQGARTGQGNLHVEERSLPWLKCRVFGDSWVAII